MIHNHPSMRVVLVDTTHPGNIGAAARAMKNMCVEQLALVNAVEHQMPEAIARAAGAGEILANATVHETLEDAIADCVWVVGTSARKRELSWPLIDPREAAQLLSDKAPHGPVAMVFGGERSGLSNAQLRLCNSHVCIPTNPDFSSLNLGAAVQLLCYEWHMAQLAIATPSTHNHSENPVEPLVSREDHERLFEHLETVLRQVDFVRESRPSQVMPRLRRLYTRARLEALEVNILRGMLTAIQKKLQK